MKLEPLAKQLSTIDQAAWLNDQGATFAFVRGRDKKPYEDDWPKKPHSLDEAMAHAGEGNNVGLLAGYPSDGIIAIDIDRDYEAVVKALGPFAKTAKIKRLNAPDRGKLLYRGRYTVKSQSWKPDGWKPEEGEKDSPWSELLSDGRQALIPPSQYDDGDYILLDQDAGIMEINEDELAFVWYKTTEGRANLPAPKDKEEQAPQQRSASTDANTAKAIVLDAWTPYDVFVYHGRAGDVKEERDGERRLLGNGGLIVGERGWYCFADQVGGYDAISAWSYCKNKRPIISGRAFWDVLREMATAKGLTLPDTRNRPPLDSYSSKVEVNGNGTGGHEDHNDLDEASPLDIKRQKFSLGPWLDDYIGINAEAVGSPEEFNLICGLTVIATALQGRANLPMSFATIQPNIYAAILAQSSVYHKSATLGKSRDMLRRAYMMDLILSELMTPEGLLKGLQQKPAGIVIRDEIGTLFGSSNTRYLRQLKPDLTALYDGYPYSRRLSNEEIRVEKPYLNILGATTPTRFYESVTLEDWHDGFLPRWLFVLPQGEPNFDANNGYSVQYDLTATRLGIELAKFNKQEETNFVLNPDAFEAWNEWQKRTAKEAYYYGDDIVSAIVTRYATYALKFGMILAAINGSWGRIDSNTMLMAMALADNYKADVHQVMSEKGNYGISGAKLQKLFELIRRHPENGLTTKEIYQSANMNRGEAQPALDKLIEIGAVRIEKAGRGQRFYPAIDRLAAKAW